jgi:hypothetical protein
MVAVLLLSCLSLATVCALAGWRATALARDLARRSELERERERWARLGWAVDEVARAAQGYRRRMSARGERDAVGADPVVVAAVRYQEACRRLAVELSAGAQPRRAAPWLPILLDPARPEDVVASNAAERVLAELAALQRRVDERLHALDHPVSPLDRLRGEVQRLRAAWRLAGLERRAARARGENGA